MKRSISTLLAGLLLLSSLLASCGTASKAEQSTTTASQSTEMTTTQSENTPNDIETPDAETSQSTTEQPTTSPPVAGSVDVMSTEEIARYLINAGNIEFMYDCVPMTQELLGVAVGNFDYKAPFSEGTLVIPMIGSIPFSMAVVRLSPDQNARAFADNMKRHADRNKWVCVSADTVETQVYGQTVLFYMCDLNTASLLKSAFSELCPK